MKIRKTASFATVFILGLAAPGFCEEKSDKPKMESKEMKPAMTKDHVMMKDGKMMVMKEGKSMEMKKDMMLENGSKVMMDGTVMARDGARVKLKEGERLGMDGMKMMMPKRYSGGTSSLISGAGARRRRPLSNPLEIKSERHLYSA